MSVEGPRGAREQGPAVRMPFPPALFAGSLALGLVLQRRMPLRLPRRGSTVGVGTALVIAGGGLGLSGLVTALGRRTTVIPWHPASGLVSTGPFRISRNPMYAGMALAQAGAALLTGSGWGLLFVPVSVSLTDRLVIAAEEQHLASRFGEDYERYRRRVRRWL